MYRRGFDSRHACAKENQWTYSFPRIAQTTSSDNSRKAWHGFKKLIHSPNLIEFLPHILFCKQIFNFLSQHTTEFVEFCLLVGTVVLNCGPYDALKQWLIANSSTIPLPRRVEELIANLRQVF